MKPLSRHRRALSPIIATVLILGLVTTGVMIGFLQVLPYMERSRAETAASSVQASLISVDNTIWDMISDSSGNYAAGQYPSQRVPMNLPVGYLSVFETENDVEYQPFECTTVQPCPTVGAADFFGGGSVVDALGTFRHQFTTSYSLIPQGTVEYLTGSNPRQARDSVAENTLGMDVSAELSMTNLSFSRDNIYHYIQLSYRPKVFVTQTVEAGNPVYNVGVYFIKLTGSVGLLGRTQLGLTYEGASVNQQVLTESLGSQGFELHLAVNGQQGVYATVNTANDALTTSYRVTVVTYTFTLSS